MSGGGGRTGEECECKCAWGLGGPLRSFHTTVLGMPTNSRFPFRSRPPPGHAPLSSSFRLSRGAQGSNPSCGVSQRGRHPQVTHCQLGTLRRFHQEPARHQHPSSDNVHHGRPGALWKVSEASHCPAQVLILIASTDHHLPDVVTPGYTGGRDFSFSFDAS